ncbi:NADP-dependent oxidoreductase [Occultella kanbiaonis]|uniref:NADP-dependent oxidoreductase n=1 Tax=Occultella kanbiaonis TaxID=2675754 RepID=UPI0013CF4989|nr:NADP-dependent oxidoreductase [Occultella kanbiaonis]
MRAVALPESGSQPQLVDIDIPAPAEGEVRVRVHAASVNGFDLAVASGHLEGMMEHRFPVVLGKDFAGVIDSVGPGVTSHAAGERVFGVVAKAFLGDGSFGEYVTVPVAVGLAKLPDGVAFAEAAGLGLAGVAALDSVRAAEIAEGSTVLVSGATGGVGGQVVQLAVAAGARVIATAHTDEEKAHVGALGATETVDYTRDPAGAVLAGHPHGVDVVFHFAGDAATLLPALRNGGREVSPLLGSPDQLPTETATVIPIYANPAPETLARLAQNQADGATRVTVQRTYPLADVPAAFADFAAGTLGKLVVTID